MMKSRHFPLCCVKNRNPASGREGTSLASYRNSILVVQWARNGDKENLFKATKKSTIIILFFSPFSPSSLLLLLHPFLSAALLALPNQTFRILLLGCISVHAREHSFSAKLLEASDEKKAVSSFGCGSSTTTTTVSTTWPWCWFPLS